MISSASAGVKAPPRIPFAFRADPIALDGLRLTRTARAVFVLLLDNARARGWRSRLSNGTLARVLGCCEMTVGRALLALERAGLIARDYTHGGRVRTGIRVVWDALQQPCGTERACVQQERGTGPAGVLNPSNTAVGLIRAPHQSQEQSGGNLPLGVNPDEVPDPATAAQFLRSLIQAGRRGGHAATTPIRETDRSPAKGAHSARTLSEGTIAGGSDSLTTKGVRETDSLAKGVASGKPPAGPRYDDPQRQVRVMIGDLAGKLATPRTGAHRLSPQALARQLAEVRRRYGNRPASGGG